MGGYYKYQSVTYSTVGSNTDEAFGSFKTSPLVVPYSNVSSEDYYDYDYDYDHDSDYVPKRTLVPIATSTRPYGHGSPTRAPPATHDDDKWRSHSPQKADEFLPRRTSIPVTTRPFGDQHKYGSPTRDDDDEWRRHTSSAHRADEFKRTPLHEYNNHGSPARTEPYPARDNDKWHPPHNSSVYNYGHPYKADDLHSKNPLVPVTTTTTTSYGPEYERMSPSSARDDQKWHRSQKPQPVISPDWRRSTPNNGNYNKPIDNSNGRNAMPPNGSNKAIINPGWSSSPRKGTQVSGPTNDIEHILEMLKQATLEAEEDNRGTKTTANNYAFQNPRTINSREAEKKYKGARNLGSRPQYREVPVAIPSRMRTGVPRTPAVPTSATARFDTEGPPHPSQSMAPPVRIRSVVPVCSAPPRRAVDQMSKNKESKELKHEDEDVSRATSGLGNLRI
ncbi:double-stranded RNA-binding protein 2-like [Senna tora]|uniref:Double-stranded RNA-binding protein 2-like n=1 Tax=Senna tora TaxID=362788 RepID=A0A834SQA4_9FABA|nr:double-stranded RNA-binding protein 2-like [Senna tora]